MSDDHSITLDAPADVQPLTTGILLYPGFSLLDVAGPQGALGMHGPTYLFWKTKDPIPTDLGLTLNSTTTFAEAPDHLDVLLIPGGLDTNNMLQDDEVLDFVRRAASTARYVTAVCTGTLILGMAGLLDGYRATTHWAFYETLKQLGVEVSDERVVAQANRAAASPQASTSA